VIITLSVFVGTTPPVHVVASIHLPPCAVVDISAAIPVFTPQIEKRRINIETITRSSAFILLTLEKYKI
jgi:hypothetical protein